MSQLVQQACASVSQFLWLREPLTDGPTGPTGMAVLGPTGPQGSPTGEAGPTGNNGTPGIAGPQGPQGVGVTGPTGVMGVTGSSLIGAAGIGGVTGPASTTGYNIVFTQGFNLNNGEEFQLSLGGGSLPTGIYAIVVDSNQNTRSLYQELYIGKPIPGSETRLLSFVAGNNFQIQDFFQTTVTYLDDLNAITLRLDNTHTGIFLTNQTDAPSNSFLIQIYQISLFSLV